jgi:hypothetical protein
MASFTESVRHASYIPADATKIKMVTKRRKCEILYRLGDFCTDKSAAEEVMASSGSEASGSRRVHRSGSEECSRRFFFFCHQEKEDHEISVCRRGIREWALQKASCTTEIRKF